MNKQIEENRSCCNSCIHRFVCFQCDDDTLVCSQYKDERNYRKSADVTREIERLRAEIKLYENTCGQLIVRDNGEVVGFVEGQEKTYINKNIARVLRSLAVNTARTEAITELLERAKSQARERGDLKPFVLVEDLEKIAKILKGGKL